MSRRVAPPGSLPPSHKLVQQAIEHNQKTASDLAKALEAIDQLIARLNWATETIRQCADKGQLELTLGVMRSLADCAAVSAYARVFISKEGKHD